MGDGIWYRERPGQAKFGDRIGVLRIAARGKRSLPHGPWAHRNEAREAVDLVLLLRIAVVHNGGVDGILGRCAEVRKVQFCVSRVSGREEYVEELAGRL